jgi:hypothetical protein
MKQHQFMTSLTVFLIGMFYSHPFDDRSKGWKGWLEEVPGSDPLCKIAAGTDKFSFVI